MFYVKQIFLKGCETMVYSEIYNNLKEKGKKVVDIFSFENRLSNFLTSMFDSKGDNLFNQGKWDRCEFELLLLLTGKVAVWKLNGELVFSTVDFIGNIDFMGVGKDANCTTLNGHNKVFSDWRNSKDVVIIFNNENHTPDMNVERYASLMGETWTSIRSAVQGTRYSKVFCVANQQEQQEVQTAIDSVKDGKPMIVRSNRILPTSEQTINSIKLTDFQESDKIQYLSTFMTYIERNFINLYGMASQGADKVAQQNEAEIKNGAFSSWVEVISRLTERKKGFEKVKEVFGVEIDYDLSEVWKKEYDRLFAEVEENNTEGNDIPEELFDGGESEDTNEEDIEETEKEGDEE